MSDITLVLRVILSVILSVFFRKGVCPLSTKHIPRTESTASAEPTGGRTVTIWMLNFLRVVNLRAELIVQFAVVKVRLKNLNIRFYYFPKLNKRFVHVKDLFGEFSEN